MSWYTLNEARIFIRAQLGCQAYGKQSIRNCVGADALLFGSATALPQLTWPALATRSCCVLRAVSAAIRKPFISASSAIEGCPGSTRAGQVGHMNKALILVENGADCRSERFRLQVVTDIDCIHAWLRIGQRAQYSF